MKNVENATKKGNKEPGRNQQRKIGQKCQRSDNKLRKMVINSTKNPKKGDKKTKNY